jgi:hypothetical protein
MQRLRHVGRNRNLNGLSVLADKFHVDDVLLVRLVPRHSDHDADAQVAHVGRWRPGLCEGDLDSTTRDVQKVVHGFCVVAQDCIDLH